MFRTSHLLWIVVLWVFAIQCNEVVSFLESDAIELQHEKEGEKEIEDEKLKVRDWLEILGLNPKENQANRLDSSLRLDRSRFHQWAPDVIIPPPKVKIGFPSYF